MRGFWILSFLLLVILSCSPKVSKDTRTYERKNPYPVYEESLRTSKGSLYRGGVWADLYGENRASKPGDVIFIEVVESLNAVESLSNQIQRSSSFSSAISAFFGISKATLGNLGAEGKSSLQAQAKSAVQQQGKLSTKLAGRVVRAYPNRTMLIEAEKTIVVNGAGRVIKLRGIVRPEDIDSTNTVTSDKIANLEVFVDGKGYSAEGGKPGWFLRLLSSAFPF